MQDHKPHKAIKVATRTRQDDATPTWVDRVLLSRGSEVRVLPGAPLRSGIVGDPGEGKAAVGPFDGRGLQHQIVGIDLERKGSEW